MSALLPKLVNASTLHSAIKKSVPNLKILDCTYQVHPPIPFDIFKTEFYGQFEKIIKQDSWHKSQYLKAHIPRAQHLNLDAAFFPSQYQRFTVYEPAIFEKYARLLGLNPTDHLVFYSRGQLPLAPMLFAARAFWLFKSYGHTNASVLNGGLNSWQTDDFEVECLDELPKPSPGNWSANDCRASTHISYEELSQYVTESHTGFDNSRIKVLDTRIRAQYNGEQPFGVSPPSVELTGSNIPHTKNVPAMELLDSKNGTLKAETELETMFNDVKATSKPIVTMCNIGMQASLAAFALDSLKNPIPVRIYSGSMYEVSRRSPELICGGEPSD
ncbi:rhodanese-like domain-containing protein [Ditylenchus destructor]|nr:rhodanese-like domain-containing protein [Ditylenchus destructor]